MNPRKALLIMCIGIAYGVTLHACAPELFSAHWWHEKFFARCAWCGNPRRGGYWSPILSDWCCSRDCHDDAIRNARLQLAVASDDDEPARADA